MKKVLVTGASGFLGSHILQALYQAGYQVHALVRDSSSRRWLSHKWLEVHTAQLDERQALSRILPGFYAIIHAAGALPGSGPEALDKINVQAPRILAEEGVNAGVQRFVYVSSRAAGGVNLYGFWKTEDEPDAPTGSYGRSKKQGEAALYPLREKIHMVNLRYTLIYGPRDTHLLPLFKLANGQVIPLPGSRDVYTPMIYVEDAARAAVAALTAEVESGSFYYISDGYRYTLDRVYEFMRAKEGRGLRIRLPFWIISFAAWWISRISGGETGFDPDSVKWIRTRYRLACPKRAIHQLNWRPEVSPEQGFEQTIRWYKQRGWL